MSSTGPIADERIEKTLDRLLATRARPAGGGPMSPAVATRDPHAYADFPFSIDPAQGDLMYVLCRAIGARRIVEFATSFGISTMYLGAAVRDNGGGRVIGSELVKAKVLAARANLAEAGLGGFVDIREGDARETLRDCGGPIDFVLIDGWPLDGGPSLAYDVMQVLAPQIRVGGLVLNDNGEPDYLAYVRDPANGFRSACLPIKRGTELSVKVA